MLYSQKVPGPQTVQTVPQSTLNKNASIRVQYVLTGIKHFSNSDNFKVFKFSAIYSLQLCLQFCL